MGQVPPPRILSHDGLPSHSMDELAAGSSLRVVLAPNAFKGTLSPAAAAAAMAEGTRRSLPAASLTLLPIADGGDGSVDAFVAAGFDAIEVSARGPLGEPSRTVVAVRDGGAVVELARTCGMARLPAAVPAPMATSTLGVGDAIGAVLDMGCREILVCVGGSASTDGGAGALVALGARLLDESGHDVPPNGANLARIASLDLSGLDPRLSESRITVAVDVESPLVGELGAAMVFAPQKGAAPDEVALLDAGLRSWARLLAAETGIDTSALAGAGAAGGTPAALVAACRASMSPGADLIAQLVGLDEAIEGADLVITGEGRLDEQSALGKGAFAVAARAVTTGVPVLAVCGSIGLDTATLGELGLAGWASCGPPDAEGAADRLAAATETAVRDWASG